MSTLTSQPAVLRAVIQIKRAATGKVEEYVLTGTPVQEAATACQMGAEAASPPHTPDGLIQGHGKDQDACSAR